jgi:hypothetical protein
MSPLRISKKTTWVNIVESAQAGAWACPRLDKVLIEIERALADARL